MLEILRRNEFSGPEAGSVSSPIEPMGPATPAASVTASETRLPSASASDSEDLLFFLEFRTGLVADFADYLTRTLEGARQRLAEIGPSFPGDASLDLAATESLRPFLQASRRLTRWTPGILAAMFARSLNPAAAHGVLAVLEDQAVPRHPLFEIADLRLTIELLQAKQAKIAELRKDLEEQARKMNPRR